MLSLSQPSGAIYQVRAQMDEVSDMASKALKIAENSLKTELGPSCHWSHTYITSLCKGISPQNMAKNMVLTYLHFRILKFPLNICHRSVHKMVIQRLMAHGISWSFMEIDQDTKGYSWNMNEDTMVEKC